MRRLIVVVAVACAVICLQPAGALAQYNSLRVAYVARESGNQIPAAFLERARAAGYTHVLVPIHVRSGQWAGGVYVGAADPAESERAQLRDLFVQVHGYGLRLIPALPSANQWGAEWVYARNPGITFEPIVNEVLRGQAVSGLTIDNLSPLDRLLRWALRLLGVSSATEEVQVSLVQGTTVKAVPSWVSDPDGYAKSFTSLVRDVVQAAFDDSGLPPGELDYVHLGYDEPCIYSGQIAREWKLLIGKSQEDLRWLYEHGPADGDFAHYGVGRLERSSNLGAQAIAVLYETRIDAEGRRLDADPTYFYTVPESEPGSPPDSLNSKAVAAYREGVRVLIADHLAQRIAETKAILPAARPILYADVFDPQGLGGYLESSASLTLLAQNLRGVDAALVDEVVVMPWWYHDTFTRHLEGGIDDAQITNVDRTLKAVLNPGWLACAAIPFPLTKLACYALNAKFVYEEIAAHPIGVDVTLHYDATGRRYDFARSVDHFIDNGFHVVFMSAFEYGAVYEDAVVQALKMNDTTAALPEDRRAFALGFASAAWEWGWDATRDAYDQPVPFNDMELIAGAALVRSGQLTSAFFGDLIPVRDSWIRADRHPVAKLDYLVVNRSVLAPDLDRVNASKANVSFNDAVLYCNRLSLRENLQPVYHWDAVEFADSFGETVPIVASFTGLTADISRNGYRLPTLDEMAAVNGSPDFVKDPTGTITGEWVSNSITPGPERFTYASGSLESAMGSSSGDTTFRVVRSLDTTPPATAAVVTPSPASGWANVSVTVTLAASDPAPGSGVAEMVVAMSGAQTLPATHVAGAAAAYLVSSEGVTDVTYYAIDHAGNVEAAHTITVRVDRTAPMIHCAAPDQQWHAANVLIACTAHDAGSGLGSTTDASFTLATTVEPGVETAAAATGTRTVCDTAGNCAQAGPVVGNRIDRRPPSITITQPAAGEYQHSATLILQYAVVDQGSGVDTAVAVLDGAPALAGHGLGSGQAILLLTELALGVHVFRIDAGDGVGNQNSASVTFTIVADAGSLLAATAYFCGTGAITSPGECNGLAAKLRAVQSALNRGDRQPARNQLAAYIHQLQAQRSRTVSPQAFATLKTDAEWLLAHLQ